MRQNYRDIKVLGINTTTNRTEFKLDENNVSALTNEETFLQYIVKVLLNTRGTNGYNENLGTYLNSFVNKGFTPDAIDDAKTDIVVAVRQAAETIKIEQNKIPSLPLSQQLKAIEVIKIRFIKATQSWYIHLSIQSKNNLRYSITI